MQSGQHFLLSFIFRFGKRILRPHEILGKRFWPNSEKSEGETDFPDGKSAYQPPLILEKPLLTARQT
jgi:hypothetical protein